MIQVDNLSKNFGHFKALDHLSLNMEKGSVYGLIGPNGAGKTTLIKLLNGIFRPDEGMITVDGQPVWENDALKERLIYVSDDLYYFSMATIKDLAQLYAGIYPQWNQDRFERLKEAFPMDENRRLIRLSKGMQKQAAFWLGLCTMPEVMILDEPVDGLDPVMRRRVWSLMLQDVAERQMTVLVSSHNLRELEDVCDHVGILHQGKMLLQKNLDEAKSNVYKIQAAFSERQGVSCDPSASRPLRGASSGNLRQRLPVDRQRGTGRGDGQDPSNGTDAFRLASADP